MRKRLRPSTPVKRNGDHESERGILYEGRNLITDEAVWRGVVAIIVFFILWEIGSRSRRGSGLPFPGYRIPAPSAVLLEMLKLIQEPSFWQSAYLSTLRVFEGFIAAMIIGIPLGLAMAVSRTFYGITFPSSKCCARYLLSPGCRQPSFFGQRGALNRLCYVPRSIFDDRHQRDRRRAGHRCPLLPGGAIHGLVHMGHFWRIILPGTLPSIVVGATVGIGIHGRWWSRQK